MNCLIPIVLLACGVLTGCVAEDSGPNAVCERPEERELPLNLKVARDARHLSQDAEKAEDISVRFGDGHSRPMSAGGPTIAEYRQVRAACLAKLYEDIAKVHHVTPADVRASLGAHRSKVFDAFVIGSFAGLYMFAVRSFASGIWRRFLPTEDRGLGILATLVISPIASVLCLTFGSFWSWKMETLRIGYGHLVERSERIPWNHHLLVIFIIGVLIFLIVSAFQYRKVKSEVISGGMKLQAL